MALVLPLSKLLLLVLASCSELSEQRAVEQNASEAFSHLATFAIPKGNAEIIGATDDGRTLVFTNSARHSVGIVDISRPERARLLAEIPIQGEPTSVAVHGSWAAVVARIDEPEHQNPPPEFSAGALLIIDLQTPVNPQVIARANIGWHPDCVKIVELDGKIFVIVAIENEPVVLNSKGEVTRHEMPGHPRDVSPPGFVDVLVFDPAALAAAATSSDGPPDTAISPGTAGMKRFRIELPESVLRTAGLAYPADPQPEYVAVHGSLAAISLQENNGVALIELGGAKPKLKSVFSTGIVSDRPADLHEDGITNLRDAYPSDVNGSGLAGQDAAGLPVPAGQRCADALAFSPDGSVLYTADEGEFNFTGGRGWSAWSRDGKFLWDDGGQLEATAAALGYYPEHRSENKGIEVEGITTAVFSRKPYAFLAAERGSFVAVYNLENPSNPQLVQLLKTGTAPEGVLAIPQRDLLITANEEAATLSFFKKKP